MSTDSRDPNLLDLKRFLTNRFRSTPAWNDLAEATSKVLNTQIHHYRRQLAKVRDSQMLRPGSTLPEVIYEPRSAVDYPVDEQGNPVPITPGTKLTNVKINRVYQFNSRHGEAPVDDFADVQFKLADGRTLNWTMPLAVGAHQERSVLISNAAMLGFDFFSRGFSTDDYRRLYDFVSLYWPEGGTKNFIRFMGFIKGIKLDFQMLWSEDDGTSEFPWLETKQSDFIPAWKGGKHYQTSHVQLEYYPQGLENPDEVSTQELADLFFYLAPIHLVLERIVAVIEQDYDIFVGLAAQETTILQARWKYESQDGKTDQLIGWAGQASVIEMGLDVWTAPIMRATINGTASTQESALYFGRHSFADERIDQFIPVISSFQLTNFYVNRWQYQSTPGLTEAAFMFQGFNTTLFTAAERYVSENPPLEWTYMMAGLQILVDNSWYGHKSIPGVVDGFHSQYVCQTSFQFQVRYKSKMPFPEILLNSWNITIVGWHSALILGVRYIEPNLPVIMRSTQQGFNVAVFEQRTRSKFSHDDLPSGFRRRAVA